MKALKQKCEICGFSDRKALELHHIVPRTDPKCTNNPDNLACICGNCHSLVHALKFVIEGRFLTSAGYTLFWHKQGEPYKVRPGIILNPDGTATVLGE